MQDYLVETCLLSHGLRSVSNELVYETFEGTNANFVWIEDGEIVIGGISRFIMFREKNINIRANRENYEHYCKLGASAALTAAGAADICNREGIALVVTCGLGGIALSQNKEISSDLRCLAEVPVGILASSIKDVLDIPKSMKWLNENCVRVLGYHNEYCTGYVFNRNHQRLDASFEEAEFRQLTKDMKSQNKGLLLLNSIPEAERIADDSIYEEALAAGRQAEAEGRYFHPAANSRLDYLTEGRSSLIQLEGLKQNVILADRLFSR